MRVFNLLIGLILISAISSSVLGYDLSEYPGPFVDENRFDATLVIGDNAKAKDVIGVTDIAMSLQYDLATSSSVRIGVGAVRVASDIENVRDKNLIVVGGPCANSVAAELLGFPDDCMEGFDVGRGEIRVLEHSTGKVAILVSGYLDIDTRAAARVLANYKDHKSSFKGEHISITDTSSITPVVRTIS